MKKKRTVYQRIRDAADRGTGLRLSADEAWLLGGIDYAITARAGNDDDADEDAAAAEKDARKGKACEKGQGR